MAFLLCTDFNKIRKNMLAHAQPEKYGPVVRAWNVGIEEVFVQTRS